MASAKAALQRTHRAGIGVIVLIESIDQRQVGILAGLTIEDGLVALKPGARLKDLETAVLSQDPMLAAVGPRSTGVVFPTGMIAFG